MSENLDDVDKRIKKFITENENLYKLSYLLPEEIT